MNLKVEDGSLNYACQVVEIDKVFPIEGKDRIQTTIINGNQIIVSKEVKPGDICLYFVSGTRLAEDYCYENNLYDSHELNKDTSKKGYLSPQKRRVRPLKLGGIISDGFLMPLNSLNYLLGTSRIDDLRPGDTFTHINDKIVCEKYFVPVRNANPGGSAPKTEKIRLVDILIPGQFRFHYETPHIGKYSERLNGGKKAVVTYKVHGCLPAFQTITMADGSLKEISKIQKGEFVLGFDHETNNLISSEVLDTFQNGKTEEWYKIEKSNKFNNAGKYKKHLYLTKNHEIFVNGQYKEIKDCNPTDTILTLYSDFKLDDFRKSLLIGIMLGDGSLDKHNANKLAITYAHKVDHEEYIDYINELLGEFCTQIKDFRISGYGTKMVRSRTRHSREINDVFSQWINKNGKGKQLPNKLTLNRISLAFWYMDDGSLAHTDLQRDRANFAICRFDEKSCEVLITSLKEYGFTNFAIFTDSNGFKRLRLNASDADHLFNDIKDLVPECMQYKLPAEYRGFFKKPTTPSLVKETFACESEIKNIEIIDRQVTKKGKIKGYSKRYDIKTKTSNFFAGDILVHNSSVILSRVKILRKLTLIDKIARFFGAKIVETEYGNIYSSGKPKSGLPKGIDSKWVNKGPSFYSLNIWEQAYQDFKYALEDGITLYGELVGNHIQGGYDYTRLIPDDRNYGFLVYRITRTNESGIVDEFSWEQIENYCAKYALTPVPFLEEIIGGEDVLPQLAEKYLDKKCIYCKNDVWAEGVCIRIDNEIYKFKSKNFLLMEDKQLEQEITNIEEQ